MEGICKRFGATVALEGVDLALEPGEVHVLVGENGAGKSTLMKILSGAYRPDSGRIEIDGTAYRPASPLESRRAGVAMIYQELALAPHLSVEENILLGAEPTRWGFLRRRQVRDLATRAMEQLGLTHIHPARAVSSLSVAEQQLVEIARALAVGCKVLILDEPTSSLTKEDIPRLFGLIRELRARGYSIVYISHFLEEALEVGDRFTVLRDGKVVASGKTAATDSAQLARWMVGRPIGDLYVRSPRTPREVVLELEDLAGKTLPVNASLRLHRGEVLGIAGLIGAGRTELLRTIFGLEPVRRGEVRLGAYVGPSSPTARWLQGMGLVSEDRKNEGLAVGLSVADNLCLTQLSHLGKWGLISKTRQSEASQQWIDRLGIRCRGPFQRIGDLSGGNQQKVALARLLYHGADVLLLDEPTRGIDVGSKAEIYRLINNLASGDPAAGRLPRAILMVSSYLPELLGICDRIAVMCRGRLTSSRPVEDWTEHSIMVEATGSEVH